MTKLARLRRFFARVFGRRELGPEPPPRIREEVSIQVLRSRSWTVEQWAEYAAEMAEVAYRDGYLLGFEHGAAKDGQAPALRLGEMDGETRRGWSLWEGNPSTVEVMRRRGDPGDPLAGVDAEHAQEFSEAIARHASTHGRKVEWRP